MKQPESTHEPTVNDPAAETTTASILGECVRRLKSCHANSLEAEHAVRHLNPHRAAVLLEKCGKYVNLAQLDAEELARRLGSPTEPAAARNQNTLASELPKAGQQLMLEQKAQARTAITYKPSLRCRLIGHQWWRTAQNDRVDDQGRIHRDIVHKQASHCDRCGVPNPGYGID